MRTYLVNYRHDGKLCALALPASDEDDAKRRLSSLLYGRIQGELVAKIPASLGPLASLLSAVRNMLAPRGA